MINCQCGSCEDYFSENELVDNCCPKCGSGNWVFGCIDDECVECEGCPVREECEKEDR